MSHHPTPRESHLAHEDSRNEAAQRLRDATRLVEAREQNARLEHVLARIAVTPCREWLDEKHDRCSAQAEFVLWGRLFKPEALGPRCYDHAAMHAGHKALGDASWAIIDLRPALRALGWLS